MFRGTQGSTLRKHTGGNKRRLICAPQAAIGAVPTSECNAFSKSRVAPGTSPSRSSIEAFVSTHEDSSAATSNYIIVSMSDCTYQISYLMQAAWMFCKAYHIHRRSAAVAHGCTLLRIGPAATMPRLVGTYMYAMLESVPHSHIFRNTAQPRSPDPGITSWNQVDTTEPQRRCDPSHFRQSHLGSTPAGVC